MTEVSIITPTFRPGGIDIALAGMRDQTFRDFEYIIVDHRYERRHDEVMALAREYGVNLIHVPEHRRNGKWAVCSSAFNTGFALAQGRVIIMLVDWTYAPPGWIEAHLQHHQEGGEQQRGYVLSPYYYHAVGITPEVYQGLQQHASEYIGIGASPLKSYAEYAAAPGLKTRIPFDMTGQNDRAGVNPTANLDEDAVLRGEVFPELGAFSDGLFHPSWLSRMPLLPEGDPGQRDRFPGGTVYTWTHLKNESVLREAVFKLNGTDIWSERGGRMSIDTDFGLRLTQTGVRLIWEPAGLAHCVNPRHGVSRVLPYGILSGRYEGRWSELDCRTFALRRQLEVQAGLNIPAPAPYSLEQLAERLRSWRTAQKIDVGSLDVSDDLFFGRTIWPDSPY